MKTFAALMPRAQSIHRTGSSVLDLAYVACGRYDGFWEFGLSEWDIAAGALLRLPTLLDIQKRTRKIQRRDH